MTNEQVASIKAHWDSQSQKSGLEDDLVTHRDRYQRMLEIDLILKYLPHGQKVVDIGCGNGYSTSLFASRCFSILGIDYSEQMITRAQKSYGNIPNAKFEVHDILNLDLLTASFDVAICQRCLINLPTWEDQCKALRNVARIIKPRGIFLMQEGSRQGREGLNKLREQLGLPRMPAVSFNNDFDEEKLWPSINEYFDIVEIRRFGLYDLISRVLHPLLVQPAEPQYLAEINRIAGKIAGTLRGADEVAREFHAFLRRKDDK